MIAFPAAGQVLEPNRGLERYAVCPVANGGWIAKRQIALLVQHYHPAMASLKPVLDVFLNPRTWPGALVYAVLLLIIAAIAARTIRAIAKRALDRRTHLDRGVVQFMTQLAQVAVWVVAVMTFLHIIPALQKLGTALLAGVSVASVVIGLAAQNTLGNFIAGLSLVLYRPFEVDDVVTVSGPAGPTTGVIEQLALGYTVIRTFDDRRLIVPNNTMASQTTVTSNYAQLRNMAIISAILPRGINAEAVRDILLKAAREDHEVLFVISCLDKPLDPPSRSLSLRMWCRSAEAANQAPIRIINKVRQKAIADGIDVLLPAVDANR